MGAKLLKHGKQRQMEGFLSLLFWKTQQQKYDCSYVQCKLSQTTRCIPAQNKISFSKRVEY